jgi:hypothetical protein
MLCDLNKLAAKVVREESEKTPHGPEVRGGVRRAAG